MIKSDIDIVDDIYQAIAPFVKSVISSKGKFFRDKRELDSKGRDVVLRLIANSIAQVQMADLSLNFYISDKSVKGQYVADTATIREICRDILTYFQDWNRQNKGKYDFSLKLTAQRIYEQPSNEHIISCRLEYAILTD